MLQASVPLMYLYMMAAFALVLAMQISKAEDLSAKKCVCTGTKVWRKTVIRAINLRDGLILRYVIEFGTWIVCWNWFDLF